MSERTTLLIDCDTGVDDALALLYLLADASVDVCGVTTLFGNTTAGSAAHNTLRVLELIGRGDIPVAVGASTSLRGEAPRLSPEVHGEDGLGDTALPAPSGQPINEPSPHFLVRMAKRHAGDLHILATGPLTNLATALSFEPRLPELVSHVTVMGGAASVPGNVTPAAEANFHHDPEAAKQVLAAPWPVTVVPLDVTMHEVVTADLLDDLIAGGSPVALFAAAAVSRYLRFYERHVFGTRAAACHDPLAAAIAVGDVAPRLAPAVPVDVETGPGPARGALIADLRGRYRDYPPHDGANVEVVLRTDRTFARQLIDRLLTFDRPERSVALDEHV